MSHPFRIFAFLCCVTAGACAAVVVATQADKVMQRTRPKAEARWPQRPAAEDRPRHGQSARLPQVNEAAGHSAASPDIERERREAVDGPVGQFGDRALAPAPMETWPPIAGPARRPAASGHSSAVQGAAAPERRVEHVAQFGLPGGGNLSDLPAMVEQLKKSLEENQKAQQANIQAIMGQGEPAGDQESAPSGQQTLPAPAAEADQPPLAESIVRAHPEVEGDDDLIINLQARDLRDVLELLGQLGDLNILASPSVEGIVTATLSGVTALEAIEQILNSTNFQMRREGNFLHVGTAEDFKSRDRSSDPLNTRVYRPNYVTATDLNQLITPLLSESVGRASVSTPAQQGIATNTAGSGGDNLAVNDALVVQDYESVLKQIDQVVAEIDRRPLQVAIEAMILSVKLTDEFQFGINWQFLRNQQHVRLGSGLPRVEPLNGGGQVNTATGGINGEFRFERGGLQFAFLDSSLGSFVDALESIGETNVIASPHVMVLNKQLAEIQIGAQLGYISTTVTETSSTQNVQFLDVGTQLRLRPFIYSDGSIRLDVHPELSTGQVRTVGGLTLPEKEVTQVTSNVMTKDGMTVIIGGLIREDLTRSDTQIPVLGSLPAVGWLFRRTVQNTDRSEIVVLLTPHIIYDKEAACVGNAVAEEFHRRHEVVGESMSPLYKRHIARRYLRRAQEAWAAGRADAAERLVRWSIHFDPECREAIELRTDILNGIPRPGGAAPDLPPPGPLDHPELPAWMLDELEQEHVPLPRPLHPLDPGVPGPQHTLDTDSG